MKKAKHLLVCLLTSALLLSGCGTGEIISSSMAVDEPTEITELPPVEVDEPEEESPDNDWAFDTPENHGVDSEILTAMHNALEPVEINSVVTVKDGVIIDEYYKEGYDENSVFRLASCSKSFTGALIGIAIGEGLIDGIDVSIAEYFPQVAGTDKENITIRHLLEHTSGIEWYEWGGNSTSFRGLVTSDNWVDYVLAQPVVSAPGSTFNYTTGGPHVLAAILQLATGESAADYGQRHIYGPLGMDSVQWRSDDQGVTDGGNGVSMTARDAAKFGQLYLNGGVWDNGQIIPAEWVVLSTNRQSAGSGRSGSYGYQWWLQSFGAGNYDTYYAMGHGGQFIFVVPELDLVTVITSNSDDDTYMPWPYFTDYVLAACG